MPLFKKSLNKDQKQLLQEKLRIVSTFELHFFLDSSLKTLANTGPVTRVQTLRTASLYRTVDISSSS